MNDPRRPVLTDEVQRALKERAIDNQQQMPPPLPPVPEGHVRYLIAINDAVSEGVARPAVLAAMLRAAADQLDPTRPHLRQTTRS